MIELTDQQRRELGGPEPMAVDHATGQRYVLVRAEEYARLKALLTRDDDDPDEALSEMNEVMAADDANDPLLESYQAFGKQP